MFEFEPGFGYDVELKYTKTDGTPGNLDLANGPLTVELSTPGIATATVDAFDPATGVAMVHIDHNGGVGDFIASVTADGDLLPGDNHMFTIVWSENFAALPPLGSTGVMGTVSGKRPTVTP